MKRSKYSKRIKEVFKEIYYPWLYGHLTFKDPLNWRKENARVYWFPIHKLFPRMVGSEEYYSQEYQDMFVDNIVFNRMEGGFFLDIGANDPIKINNTYFLEKNRNWSGIAVEPLKSKADLWKGNREASCLQIAIGNKNGKMLFYECENDFLSGIAETVKNNVEFKSEGGRKDQYMVNVRRLGDVLRKNNIKHVNYCSMDIEGFEFEALISIDFSKVTIDCFSIEMEGNKECKKVRRFLMRHGYVLVARLWQDDIYVRKQMLEIINERKGAICG